MKASQLGGGSNVYLDLFLHVTQSKSGIFNTLLKFTRKQKKTLDIQGNPVQNNYNNNNNNNKNGDDYDDDRGGATPNLKSYCIDIKST